MPEVLTRPRTIVRRASGRIQEEEETPFDEAMDELEGEEVGVDDEEEEVVDDEDDFVEPDPEEEKVDPEEAFEDSDIAEVEPEPEPVRPVIVAPKKTPRKKPAARTARVSRPTAVVRDRLEEEASDFLEALDFGEGGTKLQVLRIEPVRDPKTGKRIAGLQRTYHSAVSLEEIQNQFGGGIYKLTVQGKNAQGRFGYRASKQVEIAGDPIPVRSPRALEEEQEKKAKEKKQQQDSLFVTMLEQQAEDRRIAREESQQMQNMIFKLFAESSKQNPLAPMLEQQRADQDRRREEAAAQREAERLRWEKEREDQRRRDEVASREREEENRRRDQQFQMQLEQQKMQHEMQVKQLEMQTKSIEAKSQSETNAMMAQMKMFMDFTKNSDKDKAEATQSAAQMQMQMMQTMSELQKTSMEGQMNLVLQQLKEAKDKDDFMEAMEKFTMIKNIIDPPEADTPTWERVVDKLTEAAGPAIGGLASVMQGRQAGVPQLPAGGPRPVANPQITPGTVAVVENIDEIVPTDALPPGEEQPWGEEAPEVQAEVVDQPEPVGEVAAETQPAEAAPSPAPEQAVLPDNPLQDFQPYPENVTNEQALELLVYQIDLGLQKGMSSEEIFEKCVDTLPAAQKGILKMVPVSVMNEFIEGNVPEHWVIRSAQGEMCIQEVHALLKG